jgi:hypothetical protein
MTPLRSRPHAESMRADRTVGRHLLFAVCDQIVPIRNARKGVGHGFTHNAPSGRAKGCHVIRRASGRYLRRPIPFRYIGGVT